MAPLIKDLDVTKYLAKYNKEKDKQEIIRLFSQADNKGFRYYSDTLSVAFYAAAYPLELK